MVIHPSAPVTARGDPTGLRGIMAACLRVLGEVVDHLDDFAMALALLPGELQQVPDLGEDGTALGCARHRDATSAAELQETFLPQNVQGAKDGVLVHRSEEHTS